MKLFLMDFVTEVLYGLEVTNEVAECEVSKNLSQHLEMGKIVLFTYY